jgi:hypothetical protein
MNFSFVGPMNTKMSTKLLHRNSSKIAHSESGAKERIGIQISDRIQMLGLFYSRGDAKF